MRNLTFKVSAKMARLFGRENASNAEAAISELIKNTYDADATACIVCFLPTYHSAPNTISVQEYTYLLSRDEKIKQFYCLKNDESASLRSSSEEGRSAAYPIIRRLVDLWIIDNGTGMSGKTIEECWMVIGTNDKEKNTISKKGRARTGAKGIGRFALDRLGDRCTLYSSCISARRVQSIKWDVDWSEFDGEGKVLDDIAARLEENGKPLHAVLRFVEGFPQVAEAIDSLVERRRKWATGTVIRIGFLRDNWARQEIDHLNKTLGALIPPLEQKELNLFLFDASNPASYGSVSADILDDYDYRLEAAIHKNGNVQFDVFRNELDRTNVDPDLFALDEMKQSRFDKSSFQKKKISYCKTVEELFPGQTNKEFFRRVRELGPFKVKLLFFKKGSPSRRDADIYPYRSFHPGPRKAWLEEFGGIKIYRDNFAVRPYGELDGRAFDWLALGQRVAISPVAASRKGWKVSPQNLAGTVTISRRWNERLYDQTNREGIIENEHFAVFRNLVLRVIQEFEDDRSHIHYNLNELYKKKNKTEEYKKTGAITARRIVRAPKKATSQDAQKLARAFVAQQTEIQELRDEQTMLRALATLGTVLVSFSHEMGQLQNTMGSRSAVLSDILSSYISSDELTGVAPPFHPYTILEEWEEDDKRVKQWFTFALSSVRASRRRRRNVSLREHLKRTKSIWKGFLKPREVELNIEFDDEKDAAIMAFEIDLDSIFNNLILNSVEAFLSPRHVGKRQIGIAVTVLDEVVRIDYRDNGPGIHPSIKDPAQIFRFAVTTKVGPDGKVNGTGLGMWILAAVLQSFGGNCKAFRSRDQKGFRMELTLPVSRGGR